MKGKKLSLALFAALGMTGVALAQDVLPSSANMRELGTVVYREFGRIAKGETPFDAAKVSALYDQLAAAAAKTGASFPESIKGKTSPNSRYASLPKVWENAAEFKAAVDKLNATIAENKGKIGTEAGFKEANAAIGNACNACHDNFRQRVN